MFKVTPTSKVDTNFSKWHHLPELAPTSQIFLNFLRSVLKTPHRAGYPSMDFNQWEFGIIEDIERHYIGSAKVDLNSSFVDIQHEDLLDTDPEFIKEVDRLLNSFKAAKGCPCRDPQQHMRVLIDQQVLRNSALGGILQAETDKLCFPIEQKLRCLNRVEIITAAKRYLEEIEEPDQWWYVDFYDSGLSVQSHLYLREGFLRPQGESDGEEYLRWCSYKVRNDKLGAQRVISRLSKYKGAALKQLHNGKNKEVATRFDKLRKFPGLFRGKRAFVLGSLRHILSWKCPNEMCSYLDQVLENCEIIAGENPEALDPFTINFLQSRCPKHSYNDQEEISQAMHEKVIFATVTDHARRSSILQNTLNLQGVILTLATFFRDCRYLKAVAHLCKPILPEFKRKDSSSIRSVLSRFFRQNDEQYVEICEGRGESVRLSPDSRFSCAYLQLCIHAIRSHSGKQTVAVLEEACSVRFVELAKRVGFDTPKMRTIEAQNRDEQRLVTVQEDEYAIAIARQNGEADSHVALLQRREVISDPQFSTEVQKRERCDPKYIFLRIFQCGTNGSPGRYASAYCLLYYVVMAFWRNDLAMLVDLSGVETSQDPAFENITQHYEDALQLYEDLVDYDNDVFTDANHDTIVHLASSISPSLYPQSAIFSPSQASHQSIELLRRIIATSMRPDDAIFVKLETLFVKVVPRTWIGISETVAQIENGTLPPISPPQLYGVVQDNRFRSFSIITLREGLGLIEKSDFTNVIFMVDHNSEAQRIVRDGRPFHEICEEIIHIAGNEQV